MKKDVNLWDTAEHALGYLAMADKLPHRTEGEAELLTVLPKGIRRVLDLGTGDGRLLHLVKLARPRITAVAMDFSQTMLTKVRERFDGDGSVTILAHDMSEPLPDVGTFDAVVSSFAIHHLSDDRKRNLYAEVWDRVNPGGVFCNLEHVSSPSDLLHREFLGLMGILPENDDPSNKLLPLDVQLKWLTDLGFQHVDCYWKWRELALLVGRKP